MAVVIPAAPASPWLAAAIESCEAQGAPRVYVVGEGAAAQAGERGVVVEAAAGFAARANAGLARARADGFGRALLLNDDTELMPGALDALAAADAEVAGAVLMEWAGGVQLSGIACSQRTARVVVQTDDAGPGFSRRRAVSGAAMALDLGLWQRIGGFAECFEFYLEDVDFCLRAAAAGAAVGVVGEARVRHRGGGTRSGRSVDAAWQLGRSHALLSRRLGGGAGARGLRLACAGAVGLAWSARSVGVRGPGAFARGFARGFGTDAT